MAEVGSTFVSVAPSAKGFGAGLDKQIGPDLDKSGKRAGSRFGSALKVGAVAALAGGVVLGKFLAGSVDEAREAAKVGAITGNVIKTTGGAAKVSAKDVGALATSISNKTGIDDEAIQSASNLLLTFTNLRNEVGKGNDVFNQATQLSTDLGAALGKDPKAASIQLGKALNDPVKGITALSRVGVSFDAGQKKQIKTLVKSGNVLGAQKIILGELNKEFGGTAAAASTSGDKAGVAFGNLKEQVGTALLPVLDRLATMFTTKIAPVLTRVGTRVLPKVTAGLLLIVNKVGRLDSLDLSKFSGDADGVGTSVKKIGTSLKGIDTTSLKAAFGKGVSDTASVFSVVIGFLADHIDTLAKNLPLLIGAFIAYKSAQAAANVAAIVHLPLQAASILSNVVLASSQRALATQLAVTNGVERVGMVTRLRATAVTVASTVASKVAAGAAKVWAAGQWLLNAALTANPIGIIVVLIVALVAGLVIAYKKSDKFRAIVNAAFTVVKNVIGGVLGWLTRAVPAAFNKVLTVIRTVVDGVLGFVKKNWALLPLLLLGPLGLLLIPLIKNKDKIIKLFRETWDKVSGAVRRGISTVVGFVTKLPDRITGALGDIGGTLLGAGKDLIQGLIDGIVAKFKDLKGMLGKVTDLIPDWKGPPRKDAVLLRPAGQSIMGGLVGGITDGERDLQSTLRGVTNRIQVRAPRLEPSVSGATAGGVGGVTGRGGQEFRGTLGIDRDGVAYIRGVSRDAVRAGNVARQAAARNQATGGADFRT